MLSSAATFSFFLAIGSVSFHSPTTFMCSSRLGYPKRWTATATLASCTDAAPPTTGSVASRRCDADTGTLGRRKGTKNSRWCLNDVYSYCLSDLDTCMACMWNTTRLHVNDGGIHRVWARAACKGPPSRSVHDYGHKAHACRSSPRLYLRDVAAVKVGCGHLPACRSTDHAGESMPELF